MTTYELPPEPPIGESAQDVYGRTWKHEGINRWVLKDVDPAYRETRSWQQLFLSAPLTLVESDSWPTESEPLIVADWATAKTMGHGLLYLDGNEYIAIESGRVLRKGRDTLTSVVPVTVVPAAALPVLWSALEQWLNHANRILPSEETQLLVGAVVALREQIDALGVDL